MSLEELESQQQQLTEQVMVLAREITAAIAEDITTFMNREVRRRFIEAVDFAESVDDTKVREIKDAIQQQSEALGVDLKETLANEALWLIPPPEGELGKQLEPNQGVWSALQRLALGAAEFLAAFHFPADNDEGFVIAYRPPSYFVAGKYLPGLVEKYWKLLSRRQRLADEVSAIDLEQRRKTLVERWDRLS